MRAFPTCLWLEAPDRAWDAKVRPTQPLPAVPVRLRLERLGVMARASASGARQPALKTRLVGCSVGSRSMGWLALLPMDGVPCAQKTNQAPGSSAGSQWMNE